MTPEIVDLLQTLAGAAIVGLVGAFWTQAVKVARLEERADALEERAAQAERVASERFDKRDERFLRIETKIDRLLEGVN